MSSTAMSLPSLVPVEERFQQLSWYLDLFESGEITEGSLRRHVRLSTTAHQVLTETISQSLAAITNDPSGAANTIARCNKLLAFSGKSMQHSTYRCFRSLLKSDDHAFKDVFPFTELPREVRDMIYKFVFGVEGNPQDKKTAYGRTCINPDCCPANVRGPRRARRQVDTAIMMTNHFIRSESAPVFYRTGIHMFCCPAMLSAHIFGNRYFQANITSIGIVWHGEYAKGAFSLLDQCDDLECLEVLVTNDTTSNGTEKERLRLAYVPTLKTRLFDSAGIDELLALRGLKEFRLICDGSVRLKQLRAEVEGLNNLLGIQALLPRPT